MEEDIKILESECYYLEELGYLRENNHFIRFNQALENLIKGYKHIKQDNEIKSAEIISYREIIQSEFIPKSKIKEKIEPVIDSLEENDFVGYADELRDIMSELMEEK